MGTHLDLTINLTVLLAIFTLISAAISYWIKTSNERGTALQIKEFELRLNTENAQVAARFDQGLKATLDMLKDHVKEDNHRFEMLGEKLSAIIENTAGLPHRFPALEQRVNDIDGRMKESIATHRRDETYNKAFRHWMTGCMNSLVIWATLVSEKGDVKAPTLLPAPDERLPIDGGITSP